MTSPLTRLQQFLSYFNPPPDETLVQTILIDCIVMWKMYIITSLALLGVTFVRRAVGFMAWYAAKDALRRRG